MPPLIVIDCETTSLDPAEGGIWDLAACAVQEGRIISEWQSLVWPGRDCLQEEHLEVIRKVSGIEPGPAVLQLLPRSVPEPVVARARLVEWIFNLAGTPRPETVQEWSDLRTDAGEIPGKRQVIRLTSFNRPFDQGWLESAPWSLSWHLSALGYCRPEWTECLMEQAAARLGIPAREGVRRVSLKNACVRLGVRFIESHRALADARAAAELALRINAGETE